MRNLVWIILAAIIVGGGYMLFSGKTPTEVVSEAADAVNAPEALEAASDAADTVAEAAQETVADAVDATQDAAQDVAGAVTEVVEDAADAATDAAGVVAETTEATADAGSETAAEAIDDAAEAAAEGTQAAAVDPSMMDQLLSVEGFDLGKVSEVLDGSDLSDVQKMTLKKALEAGQDNPELLGKALERIRELLNL